MNTASKNVIKRGLIIDDDKTEPASKVPCQDDRFKYIDEIKTRYPSLTIENTNTAAIIDVRSIDVFENAAPTHKASATNNGTSTSKTLANMKTRQQNQNKMLKHSAEKVPLSLIMRPQQSVDSIDARSRDAADLLDYLRAKLEQTRAANEELQEKNSRLTSQLEVTTVKVAEVESARATINLAYSRLKVVSDGQARKIDDLEDQLMKLSASEHHHIEKCCHKCHEAACPLFAMLATASSDHAPAKDPNNLLDSVKPEAPIDSAQDEELNFNLLDVESSDEDDVVILSARTTSAAKTTNMVSQQVVKAAPAARKPDMPAQTLNPAPQCESSSFLLKCNFKTFMAQVDFYKKNKDSQLKYNRNKIQQGLIPFNDCKEGFMIKETVWRSFVENRDKLVSVNTLFKDLVLGLLDEKALFYLKLGSKKIPKVSNRAVLLAPIHPKVLTAVYQALGKDLKSNPKLHFVFKRHLTELRKRVSIVEFE